MAAINADNQLKKNLKRTEKTTEKLASGVRINRAGDDAAGLAISEKMRAQVRGLDMAQRNAQDGISLIQTAEGALGGMHSMLQRMRELGIQAANGTYTSSDKQAIAEEMSRLADELDTITKDTEFNTKSLLFGAIQPIALQIGANSGQTMSITIDNLKLPDSGTVFGTAPMGTGSCYVDLSNYGDAMEVVNTVDSFIDLVSGERAKLGAAQNRLEHTIQYLGNASENLASSESRIRDMDMAKGVMELTKNQVLEQAGNAMLAQANSKPNQVLSLLQ